MNELNHEQAHYYLHIGREALGPTEKESLSRHLAECGDCSSYAADLSTLQATISKVMHAQWDTPAPAPATDDGIQTSIQRKIAQKRVMNLTSALASGAVILALVAVAAWLFRPPAVAPTSSAAVPTPINQTFGNTITLLGYGLSQEQLSAGGTFTITLFWQAPIVPHTSYAVFIHLQDANDRLAVQSDSLPVNGTRPTTGWKPDEVIQDTREIKLPGNLTAGPYKLLVGLYDPKMGTRLKTGGGKDALTLATVIARSSSPTKTYPTILSGKSIDLSTLRVGETQGQAQIEFKLNDDGTRALADFTAKHIGQYVAVTLDNKVLTCPKILAAIASGAFAIQGQFTLEQAQQMVEAIKSNPERLEIVGAGDTPLPLGEIIQMGGTP